MFSHFTPRRLLPATTMTLLCAMLALPAAAQWKWRDAQGRIQYSDRPPPTAVPDRDVLQRPAAPTAAAMPAPAPAAPASAVAAPPAAASAASAATAAGEGRRRQAAAEQEAAARRADEERQARQRGENCTRAREYARTLESGQRIARTGESGERQFLDDGQRGAELRRAREVIASDCR